MSEVYMILVRKKISKYRNFYDICPENKQNSRILHDFFCAKTARILHNNCPKNIFLNFRGGGGARAPCPPSPTPISANLTLFFSYFHFFYSFCIFLFLFFYRRFCDLDLSLNEHNHEAIMQQICVYTFSYNDNVLHNHDLALLSIYFYDVLL